MVSPLLLISSSPGFSTIGQPSPCSSSQVCQFLPHAFLSPTVFRIPWCFLLLTWAGALLPLRPGVSGLAAEFAATARGLGLVSAPSLGMPRKAQGFLGWSTPRWCHLMPLQRRHLPLWAGYQGVLRLPRLWPGLQDSGLKPLAAGRNPLCSPGGRVLARCYPHRTPDISQVPALVWLGC